MANLVETMERKAFGVAVDATLKNLNKHFCRLLTLQRNLWETTSAKKRMMAREQ